MGSVMQFKPAELVRMASIKTMCVLILIASATAFARAPTEPEIQGEWIQGGMLFGKTSPTNKVWVSEQKAHVTQEGAFVFGIGRDAESVNVVVENPEGARSSFEYAVQQREYPTQRIEGVEKKYVAPPKEVTQRIKEENAQVWKARQTITANVHFAEGFTWPLIGPITGVYGSQRVFNGVPKRPHYGLDIAGPVGAKVVAPAPGVVTLVHSDMYYSGGTLIIDHGQGISSTFIHLHKVLVKEGDHVARGDLIAEVGATGRVTGPHLDWRINWFNERLDPQLVLPEMPKKQASSAH